MRNTKFNSRSRALSLAPSLSLKARSFGILLSFFHPSRPDQTRFGSDTLHPSPNKISVLVAARISSRLHFHISPPLTVTRRWKRGVKWQEKKNPCRKRDSNAGPRIDEGVTRAASVLPLLGAESSHFTPIGPTTRLGINRKASKRISKVSLIYILKANVPPHGLPAQQSIKLVAGQQAARMIMMMVEDIGLLGWTIGVKSIF